MIKVKTQSIIALFYFLIAASLGILLRLFPVTNINATYKYLVHTHSHIALLGWVYVALTTLIFHLCIKKEAQKKYTIQFWCTQITIIGMLLSFPITGYALYSIIFSTLFLVCTYWFYAIFKKNNNCKKETSSYKFINASLLFLIVSSIGPWALGIIMNTLGNTSHWYKNAIYFYLHFQYNGWFIFCLLGLFFLFLEKNRIYVEKAVISSFYKLMIASCILTVCLSFLWIKPPVVIFIIGFIGAIIQLIALLKFRQIINIVICDLRNTLSPFTIRLLTFIYALFVIKIVLQFLNSIPYFAELTAQIIDFVIGYLHLNFIGIVSLTLFVFLSEFSLLKLSNFWIKVYILGFVLSETLIFYKGFCNWQQLSIINNYYLILMLISSLLPIAVLGVFIQNIKSIFSTPPTLP